MRAVVLTVLLIFSSGISSAQTPAPGCRRVEIDTPRGALLRDETYYVSARIHDSPPRAPELIYQWKLPDKPHFEILQNGFGAAFKATEDLDGLEVNVTLLTSEKNGNCRAEVAKSFQIYFNPGTPLVLDDYDSLPIKEERERLDNIAFEMRDNDYNALFVIRYTPTDTKASVEARVRRIITQLSIRARIPRDRFSFTYSEFENRRVTIYALPKGQLKTKPSDWLIDIQKLKIPRRKIRK